MKVLHIVLKFTGNVLNARSFNILQNAHCILKWLMFQLNVHKLVSAQEHSYVLNAHNRVHLGSNSEYKRGEQNGKSKQSSGNARPQQMK